MMKHTKWPLNLHLFDGDAGEGAAAAAGGDPEAELADAGRAKNGRKSDLSHVQYGKRAEPDDGSPEGIEEDLEEEQAAAAQTTKPDKNAEFEKLIKGDYKEAFDARVQGIIDGRFRDFKTLQEQVGKLQPVMQLLSGRYGVDATDVEALSRAVEEDNSFYEEEAERRGLTVEQLKEMKRIERENEAFRKAQEERERVEQANRIYAGWMQQAEAARQVYPNLRFEEEARNQTFTDLLRSGVDVKTAYEVIHKDDILGGAMQYAAQKTAEKVTNNVRARAKRPAENGAGAQSASRQVTDVTKLQKEDIYEILRRVERGEKISF